MTTEVIPIGRIMLKDARIAFTDRLFKPGKLEGSDGLPNFGCSLIIVANHPQLKEIESKMIAVAKAKWKEEAAAIYKNLKAQDRLALHDGDLKAKFDGFAGNFFLNGNAKETEQPTYFGGALGTTQLNVADAQRLFYAGCYVNASIELWAQDNPKGGKRINTQLRGIQFARKGDAFSAGRPADASEFEPVEGGADADEFGGDNEFA
jgi:hypothetical protein